MKYTLIFCLILSSCASYQFGDGTKALLTLVQLHNAYCQSQNEAERDSLISLIRLKDPDYNGICPKIE